MLNLKTQQTKTWSWGIYDDQVSIQASDNGSDNHPTAATSGPSEKHKQQISCGCVDLS